MLPAYLTRRQPLGAATLLLLVVTLVYATTADYGNLQMLSVVGLLVYFPSVLGGRPHWGLRGAALLGQGSLLFLWAGLTLVVTFLADGGRTGWQVMDPMDWVWSWGVMLVGTTSTIVTLIEWIREWQKSRW